MVLYYGLLALETANNTIAAATGSSSTATTTTTTTTTPPGLSSDRTSLSQKQKYLSNSIGKMPLSSSSSSSNSWIYTEDLRKRFEERYADYRYVFVPVYIDRKSNRHSHSTTAIPPSKIDCDNSWMYSTSLRDHLYYSTSKMSLPLRTNKSSSTCCVTNHGFMRDELPIKKDLKTRLFKRSSSTKDKSRTALSSSSLQFSPLTSSTLAFSAPTTTLVRHRTSDVVEEEDDEGIDDENHSVPLIKHDSTAPSASSAFSTTRKTAMSSTDNKPIVHSTTPRSSELVLSTSTSSHTKSWVKLAATPNNKLTRLRSFFFKSSTPSPSFSRTQQQQQQQQQTTLSSSSLPNRISRT